MTYRQNIQRSARSCCMVLCFFGWCVSSSSSTETTKQRVDFNRDIRTILADNCYQCHGPDEDQREADLRLDTRAGALADLGGYSAIVPGDAAQSELVVRLTADDQEERMPPADSGKTVSAAQIELVRRWIAEGADWPEHWSFVPPQRAPLPKIVDPAWANNEIDYFVSARLAAKGLKPSPPATRRTLLRRLSFDLTGLPPSLEEIEEFLTDGDDKTVGDDRENSSVDQDEQAYERLVDRLLGSPHFGERMAVAWLDQARYADTNGYSIDGGRHMWLWRDWVINAYNQNMPFDQFTIEQLAGDLLPQATESQRLATGFNRNHMITHEGGTIPEENLTNYVVDRVKTTSEVFLGLTLGCAQCHDHKFDPLTQTDFYRFFAFFNRLDDKGLDGNAGKNAGPTMKATAVVGQDEVARCEQRLARLREQLQLPQAGQKAWELAARKHLESLGKELQLHPLKIHKFTTPNRGVEKLESDDVVLSIKSRPRSPSIVLKTDVDNISGLRIEFLPHPSLPKQGLGHGNQQGFEGSFILTSFSASADALPADQVNLYKTIAIRDATASSSHEHYRPRDALDPRGHNGWSPHPNNQTAQHITFTFEQPINGSETPYLTTLLVWGGGEFGDRAALSPGQYRFFAITGNDDGTNLPENIQAVLRTPAAERSAEAQRWLRKYYATVAPELETVRYEIKNLSERLDLLTKPQDVMVMNTAAKPRETHILNRGQYDQPGDLVTPGVPECLPPLPAGVSADRLGLARWLVDSGHPLTARVAVNRIWQLLFGTGIVASSADFGSQGQPPSHPELLDTLAIDFMQSGWDVKRLIKKMVMSATYRQSSSVTPALLQADPGNELLSRGPRFRLQAEFVRDSALKISGLLVDQIGGPSVKPYQPSGLWREISHFGSSPATAQVFVQDHGSKLYRRSMYTYWKRTVPPPSMISFDAPNRETCTIHRATTNTPLQALVLLNDPQFVEASRALAQRIIKTGPKDTEQRLTQAFELATARRPMQQELDILKQSYERALVEFQSNPKRALGYLQVGESQRDTNIDPVEHAAWTSVASMILNLSETITKE